MHLFPCQGMRKKNERKAPILVDSLQRDSLTSLDHTLLKQTWPCFTWLGRSGWLVPPALKSPKMPTTRQVGQICWEGHALVCGVRIQVRHAFFGKTHDRQRAWTSAALDKRTMVAYLGKNLTSEKHRKLCCPSWTLATSDHWGAIKSSLKLYMHIVTLLHAHRVLPSEAWLLEGCRVALS